MPRSTPIAVLLLVVAGLLGAGDAFAKQASGRSPLELAQAVERRAAAAAAAAEAARRLDAKRAFEAADDAMDYYQEKDRREAAAAARAAAEAPFQPVLVQFDQR